MKIFLDQLNNHFCDIMNPSSSIPPIEGEDEGPWLPDLKVEDVWAMLTRLKCKATGSDDIPDNIYKKSAIVLAEPVHHLITECFRQKKFPLAWKVADVIPVPKAACRSLVDTRPISLLPIHAKIAEKVILAALRKKID